MLINNKEVSPEHIGKFVEHMSNHDNVYGIDIRFNPFTVYVEANDDNLAATKSIVDWYVDWQERNPDAQHFDIIIE